MAKQEIIAVNQTGSPITLDFTGGIVVPGSGEVLLTGGITGTIGLQELQHSDELYDYVTNDNILIKVDAITLSKAESLNVLEGALIIVAGTTPQFSLRDAILHKDATTNPHSVTKTQVSLGNVTDDAQLKRAANDFTTFTEKTASLDEDMLLIEDSAAGFAKKKATVTNVIFGAGASDRNQIASAVNGPITPAVAGVYALVEDLTITPPAGTYMVYASINCIFLKNTGLTMAIYAGGTIYAPSVMNTNRGASNNDTQKTCTTQGEVTVNGSQAIEIQAFYAGTNTVSYNERSMIIMRTQ